MKKTVFDTLREWGTLSDDQLPTVFSKRTARTLSTLVQALGTVRQKNQAIDSDNFSTLVKEMRELLNAGSTELGDTIIRASHFMKQGKIQDAVLVYHNFIASCPSDYFRTIAQKELDHVLSGKDSSLPREITQAGIKQLSLRLSRLRNLLGQCARQISDLKIHTGENLRRIGEADRNICDIQADIERMAKDKTPDEGPKR